MKGIGLDQQEQEQKMGTDKKCEISADDCTAPKYMVKMVVRNHKGNIAEAVVEKDGVPILVCEECKKQPLEIPDVCNSASWQKILKAFSDGKQPLPSQEMSSLQFTAAT